MEFRVNTNAAIDLNLRANGFSYQMSVTVLVFIVNIEPIATFVSMHRSEVR